MSRKVAFITGASRGIGAETAVQLAKAGYDVAITARTLKEGAQHAYGAVTTSLSGSLELTAARIEEAGGRALCLTSDILKPDTVLAALDEAVISLGPIDLLFNNACYQGPGNLSRFLEVENDQVQAIFMGNVTTPTMAVQKVLPGMIERGRGVIINMVSGSAVNNPPVPVDQGGWSFAYPASKAALIRMVPALRVEHPEPGMRFFNVEPGFVYTEVMKANLFGEEAAARFGPTDPADVAEVIRWLATSKEAMAYHDKTIIFAPQLYKSHEPPIRANI
ncbi:MAG: SDR family NAD(P)-dependent oxidoreductase [Halieaceae bacterium]|nr:SDR family NAD(P)-dependent oxidoreductase [Halieaceae bacterium]